MKNMKGRQGRKTVARGTRAAAMAIHEMPRSDERSYG
jgi:hypothetical protein